MREASLEQSLLAEHCQLIANTQEKKEKIGWPNSSGFVSTMLH